MTEDLPQLQDPDTAATLDPSEVSPLVAWLASHESKGVTGRVFAAQGRRISVLEGWSAGPSRTSPRRWRADELGPLVDELLTTAAPNADMSGTTLVSARELLEVRNAAGEPVVVRELDDHGVLTIRLNRPERANAWIEAMEVQYFAALDLAADDPRVRAIVLTGTGRAFCPGMDMERLREVTEDGRPYDLDRRPQTVLRTIPKPVVAAVNGACAGIGFVQALMADVRITAREAKWTASFSRIGLVAEDAVAWRLQRLAGEEAAADVLLSARVMSGDEVVGLRIASRAVEAERPDGRRPSPTRGASRLARRARWP